MQTPAQQTGQPGGKPSSCSSVPPTGNGPLRIDCLPCGEGMSAAHTVRRLVGEVSSARDGRQTATPAPGYFAQCPGAIASITPASRARGFVHILPLRFSIHPQMRSGSA